MDMSLAQKVAEAPPAQQRFILGALWSEVEKALGDERANDLVRQALEASKNRT